MRQPIDFAASEKLSIEQHTALFKGMLKPRMIEEKMLSLLRQGKISKWFSGIGQEAISVGCTMALDRADVICTLHRNLGVFTSRDIPLHKLLTQWQGKAGGFTKGRDRSFHFGAPDYGIIGMISHLGPQLSLAAGVALAHKLRRSNKIALAFTGEGGTSEGEFHEALNVAAVWQLPVIFVIENNGYGLSTPTREQYHCEHLAHKGIGYGMEAHIIDGNNIVEVYATIKRIANDLRNNPRPILIEAKTFRMRGHEEASGTKYVPQTLLDTWGKKDPIKNYQHFLIEKRLISEDQISSWSLDIKQKIESAITLAGDEGPVSSSVDNELSDVYAKHSHQSVVRHDDMEEARFVDAIHDGLHLAMEKHQELVLMGQDIAEYGGVFKITEGLVQKYGRDRVRNTPLCESAILGLGLGLSLAGIPSMVEMQFADFVSCGFNQIANNIAKIHYRWGGMANMVIRMPAGGSVGAGPFHSQTNEAWFFHLPGVKIVYPSNPYDVKGLLLESFEDPNPILFFEHKALYRKVSGKVPKSYYNIPLGQAAIVRDGTKASIITYGLGVHWALEVVQRNNWDVEVVDLRTILPWDQETVLRSVRKTHRALILHEATMTGGVGAELSAYLNQHAFDALDAPIVRTASLDTPIPFASSLESLFLPDQRLEEDLQYVLNY